MTFTFSAFNREVRFHHIGKEAREQERAAQQPVAQEAEGQDVRTVRNNDSARRYLFFHMVSITRHRNRQNQTPATAITTTTAQIQNVEQPQSITSDGAKDSGIEEILNIATKLTSQCSYGIDFEALLAPTNNFYITKELGKHFTLHNFGTKQQDSPPFKGVCHELTYSVGRYLQTLPEFKDYVVNCGAGACHNYFNQLGDGHAFLVLWPKSKNTEIESQIKETYESDQYQADDAFGDGGVLPFPKGAIVIDPSFKYVSVINDQRPPYILNSVHSLDELEKTAIKDDSSFPLGDVQAKTIPLCLASKILDEGNLGESIKDALLFLKVDQEGYDIKPELLMKRTQTSKKPEPADQVLDALPHGHAVLKFVEKLKASCVVTDEEKFDGEIFGEDGKIREDRLPPWLRL